MTKLELERLEDFKKVLTYRLVTMIHHDFKDNYKLYFEAPCIWAKWRNHQLGYDKRIYKLIIMFNQTALSKHQCMHIFGKDKSNKWIAYASLIANDSSIKTFSKGTVCMNGRRFGVKKRYQLPFELIKSIFEDEQLLKKVIDAGSGYYTDRQRRLIFTQINDKKKGYHYKTMQELAEEMSDKEKIDALLADESIDWED